MARTKAVTYYVAVSDLSKPPEEQEGILLEVEGRGGDTEKNRAKALSIVNQMWANGEIADNKFPDGITKDNIFYVRPDNDTIHRKNNDIPQNLPPVLQGAQEIIQLTKLQIEIQEATEEGVPYIPIIEAVLDRSRPLTPEEKDLAKDKKYGKIIERIGKAVPKGSAQRCAEQEEYQQDCTGNGKLIINAIAWQLDRKNAAKSQQLLELNDGS